MGSGIYCIQTETSALESKQLLGSWNFYWETAVVGAVGPQLVSHSNITYGMEFLSVYYEYALLPLVNKEAILANDLAK